MPSLLAITAPFALILPLLGQSTAMLGADAGGDPAGSAGPDYDVPVEGPYSPAYPASQQTGNPLEALQGGQVVYQARIEQRIIIRISPRRQGPRNDLLAQLPQRGLATQFEERETDRCVPMAGIAGVQTGNGNRLLLFMQDNRIMSLNLERACRARDFYSGFYIERSDDGQLCVGRDELQSRSGAKCEVERMRQLVAVTE